MLHFSKADPFDLSHVCAPHERVLCLPVYQEILQGLKDEAIFRSVKTILEAADFVESPLSRELFTEAAQLYRSSRRHGRTVRSSVDCLIASCALRHDLVVLHRDRDFAALASVSPLKHQEV